MPCTTWYVKIDEMASVERFPLVKTEPMAWKASLEGAKMVTSVSASTVSVKFVAVRAPAREVTFNEPAVSETDWGIVRTLSMIWMTPPVKLRSCIRVN